MVFREGDNALIQLGESSIKISARNRMELESILLDKDEEDAWCFLNENVYPLIKGAVLTDKNEASQETHELDRIIKEKDYHGALEYVREVLYKKVKSYMKKPACKPFFELP